MRKQRKVERKIFSTPTLYFLFGVYLIGTGFAAGVVLKYDTLIPFPSIDRSFALGLGRYVLYYGAILLFSRMPCGVFVIPIIVWFKAFVYSIAISAFIEYTVWTWADLTELCMSAVVYLSGFLYFAALSFSLSLCRLKKRSLRCEHIKEVRRGILFAGICAVIGAATEAALHTT